MSDYQQYLNERDKIDFFIQKGYRFNSILEHLDGATIEFVHTENNEKETLTVGTANGRKYFSSLLVNQNLGVK
ncbi:hypothetical protein [Neobacillus sp. FSL H8-0543]|uniref:hypothetical protein n=1 Tax=Neobacillus sp. FSL H8-0543 TaxID=2954672 RepID=UPI003158D45D